MILARLTQRKDRPFWEWLWTGTALADVDANMSLLFGRCFAFAPAHRSSNTRMQTCVMYAPLVLSFITYARFCYLIIGDITNFLGVVCFIVRKKDKDGEWHSTVPRADVSETAKSK